MSDEAIDKRNELAGQRVIKMLQLRHMDGYYVRNKQEALLKALSLIPEGSVVGWGGSNSIKQIGLKDALRRGNYRIIDRETAVTPEERTKLERQCLTCNYFLMSSNAITEDGQLVNLDGKGNRVAALCFGPDNVIVIAGMNKLVHSVEDAISRVRHTVAPINAIRFPGDSPCRKFGICGDCHRDDCICSQLVITGNSLSIGRIKVILVGEALGY